MNMKNVMAASLVAGLIAGSVARAEDAKKPAEHTTAPAHADKMACDGKGKNSCKGEAKAAAHADKKKKHAEAKAEAAAPKTDAKDAKKAPAHP